MRTSGLPDPSGSLTLFSLLDIDFAYIFIVFLVLLFSLTVHETAHAWVADVLGDPTARRLGRISLNPVAHIDPIGTILLPVVALVTRAPVIGWAKPVPVSLRNLRHPRRDYLLVAAAGPASNLVLAVIASIALKVMPINPQTLSEVNVSAPLAVFFRQALDLNLLLAVFNMVPIPPLDGGNVLAGLLPERLAYQYDRLVRPYGFFLIYALMLTGVLWSVVTPPLSFLQSWLR